MDIRKDCRTVVLVFCIDDVSIAALNDFLEQAEDLEYDHSCCFQIMDSLDLATITEGHDAENLVPSNFTSPFIGWTIKEVKRWFIINVREKRPHRLVNRNFVIIDKHVESAKDEEDTDANTVILCDVQTRMFKAIRMEFPLVLATAIHLDQKVTMRQDPLGIFWRSGRTCTVEAYSLVYKNGIYFHKGVPEIDQGWRAFNQEWRAGGPRDFDSCSDSDEETIPTAETPQTESPEKNI